MGKKAATSTKPVKPAQKQAETWSLKGYEEATVRRSELHPHERNPRYIDKPAFRKLRESLKRNKLIEPIVVNRRREANGFPAEQDGMLVIVGGHQRIKVADEIFGYPEKCPDYDVPIARIEVAPGREEEIVILLNNEGLQGQWDAAILEDIFSAGNVEIANTGFERADLAHILDDGMLDGLFGEQGRAQAAAQAPVIDQLNEIHSTSRQFEKDTKAAASGFDDDGGDDDSASDIDANDHDTEQQDQAASSPAGQVSDEMVEGMRQRRRQYVERQAENNESQFLLVLVAETEAQLAEFIHESGLPNQSYVPVSVVAELMGIKLGRAREKGKATDDREPAGAGAAGPGKDSSTDEFDPFG